MREVLLNLLLELAAASFLPSSVASGDTFSPEGRRA
jgi:hypothetical protein